MSAHENPAAALRRLYEVYGFGVHDTAELMGARAPDLRDFNYGRKPMPAAAQRELLDLCAFTDALAEFVDEPATWLILPLVGGFNVRPADLYRAADPETLLDLAAGCVDPVDVLDRVDPDWREKWRSHYEVFTAADGELSMRPRRCSCEVGR
ncbi:hypothetical protein ACT17_15115 [Mycolicibacterium conceptionense]|uniref:Uncharacterized protein n=1 Tax=Mycolicibacterium conceptionense TaxID=451644 RepID=A0A0J8U869_9MYCO|nr:hypothetical protein [Mycolicibacterium conceptionense]KMV17611.1 hypothetical protein ACT17_15115 [Mycolicibacterium conceptionense]